MAPILEDDSGARPLTALRSRALRGRFKVAPDSLLFCLAAMLAAEARGDTVLYRDAGAPDADLAATLRLLEAVGARPKVSDDRWEISGLGVLGLLQPEKAVDFSGADRATPLALGLLGSAGFPARLIGTSRRGGVPLSPTVTALRKLGIDIREQRTGHLPISVESPRTAVPFVAAVPKASPEAALRAKAALLLAALALPGVSTLLEVLPLPDQPERLLRHFGAHIVETTTVEGERRIALTGLPGLGGRTLTLAGDADLAMFPLVAALIVPDSDVLIENVPMHPARFAVLTVLEEMGGDIEVRDRRVAAGEDVADLRVRHSPLLGLDIDPRGLTAAAVPVLAIAGAFAAGETHLPRLGLAGETALHKALADGLAANGATARAGGDGLRVGRPVAGTRLGGGAVRTGDNPYLAAAFLVFGLAAADQVTIDDVGPMNAEFPDLVSGLEGLGAEFYRLEAA